MPQNKSRFVLVCQHVLAVATVVAIAAPASSVGTLDIVGAGSGDAAAATGTRVVGSLVAAAPVTTKVTEVPLGGVAPAGVRALSTGGARVVLDRTVAALSAPEPVSDYATIGVSWDPGVALGEDAITVVERTLKHGTWSRWTKIPFHTEHDADPHSAEAAHSRPGTDPFAVGYVDRVQVRVSTPSGRAPKGLRLALIDPGRTTVTRHEAPAIDTGRLSAAQRSSASLPVGTPASVTPEPKIYSRQQWGADESLRDKPSLHYGEVHAGFVHHTVNANDYSRADVPAIIRGIYAYHTQVRGWSDIGYNFLVDRFGRIWEGRYGGVARPVVGAHTLGYNDDSFAMSAIGNYDIARPSTKMVRAFGRLFAWKLSLSGVRPTAVHQWVELQYLPAIDGHRDVGQTACPGRYLYAKIPRIRTLAARRQVSFASRQRQTDLAGNAHPDIVVRDKATKRAYVLRTTGSVGAGNRNVMKRIFTGSSFRHADKILNVGDWNGDGHDDVITRSGVTGNLYLRLGDGAGHLATAQRLATGFGHVHLLSAVGDVTGDGFPDLMGQPANGDMMIYPGNGGGGIGSGYEAHSAIAGSRQVGVGLWTSDGAPDSVVRDGDRLVLYPGNGPGGLTGGTTIFSDAQRYDWLIGIGDVNGDGHPDLLARSRFDKALWLLPGTGNGIGHRRLVASGFARYNLGG